MRRLLVLLAVLFSLNSFAQNNLELADQAFDNGDYAATIQYATEHLAKNPKDAKAYILRSGAEMKMQKYAEALQDADMAIKYAKKKGDITISDAYTYRAMVYTSLEEYDKAEADYNKSVQLSPKDAKVYARRADFFYERGRFEDAEKDYRTALSIDALDVDNSIGIGRCLIAQEKIDEAEKHLKQIVKLNPTNTSALQLYSFALLLKEDYRAFLDNYIVYMDLSERPSLDPLSVAAKHEFVYALKKVTEKINASENKQYWLSVRARLYRENKQYDEALADLHALEAYYGDSVPNLFVLNEAAMCYDEKENFSESAAYYTRIINYLKAYDSEDAYAYLKRAIAYREIGEYKKAVEDCNKAVATSVDYAGFAYYLRGVINEAQKDDAAAFEDYNKSILYDSTYAYSYLMRGEQYLFNKKDTIRAMKDFERILQLDTVVGNSSCRQYALMFCGQKDEAKKWMQQMIDNDPDNAGNYYDAACLYARMGEKEAAIQYLSEAINHGFRRFLHMETDDDLDPIRECQEYQDLINQHKKEKVSKLFEKLK